MRDDNPGDLGIRLGFGRVYGTGPDAGTIKPSLEISDGTSGRVLSVELTPELLTEILAGGEARVTADKVTGFKGLRDFGKYHQMLTRTIPVETGDYSVEGKDARKLPGVAKVIAELEQQGYRCDSPRRNNGGKWVIIGRKYTDERPA